MPKRVTLLNAVLAEINEKFLPNAKQKIFSIKFISKAGELVFLPRAVASGLRTNMKAADLKAVLPVDFEDNAIGHVYPVWIHAIVEFNGMPAK
jgi:hypothetical protein